MSLASKCLLLRAAGVIHIFIFPPSGEHTVESTTNKTRHPDESHQHKRQAIIPSYIGRAEIAEISNLFIFIFFMFIFT